MKKENKLKSTKTLELVFKQGKSHFVYPIKIFILKPENENLDVDCAQIAVSVSKKYYSRAVDRNLLKRRMRESMRLILKNNSYNLNGFHIICIYVGKTILDYSVIDRAIHTLCKRISHRKSSTPK
ncbi:MAG: ribonuclease P protein component [Saprospiraceae bacterium]